jgi:hypothetical protein
VWDNLNAHVSGMMAGLVAARDWLTFCQLPPYARELNPVEPAAKLLGVLVYLVLVALVVGPGADSRYDERIS